VRLEIQSRLCIVQHTDNKPWHARSFLKLRVSSFAFKKLINDAVYFLIPARQTHVGEHLTVFGCQREEI